MTNKLRFYTDRAPVDTLPNALYEEMVNHYLIDTSDRTVSFSGIVITEFGINVFLPRNTLIPKNEPAIGYRYASLLMKGLQRYTQDKTLLEINNNGDGEVGGPKLSIISNLLEDYCTHGLYTRRYKEQVLNTGKPDWKRTIASQVAFVSAKGPVYLDISGTRQRYISNCDVAKIHAFVIRELDRNYSWIITGSDISIADGARDVPCPTSDKMAMLTILENELRTAYSEREIRLLHMLLEYIRNMRGSQSSSELIGLRHFHGMWESMLDKSLKWVFPVNKLLPIPAYRFDDNDLCPAASKGQRTDTVLKCPNKKRFVVIDAKYYGAQDLSSAPGWPDIVKQFFYAKALRTYSKDSDVDNAFVFPGNGPLRSVHMQDRDTLNTLDSAYPVIRCLYLEPMDLLEHYVSGRKLEKFSNRLMYPGDESMIEAAKLAVG